MNLDLASVVKNRMHKDERKDALKELLFLHDGNEVMVEVMS